ncbi:transporter substrate-binding domain-containing protein [Nostoc sphaeroides CHAB 2801]|uniref:transporter substrate-binding domain-containing protein n=1 Tax=Nostoc sphaeroides TaxID=446679 RepID=UPI001E475F8D|nr:transporter substrate-binding domain-containing protein [Nostoc sphaeroides]MCC5634249.1 transporter substrate-binding domain-containing protein [Nostoc sphaeroides CHAB 2801]
MLNSSGVTQTPPVKSSMSSRVIREARVRNYINWGLRTVSPPISFQDNFGQWQGFCTDLIGLLENYLKDNQFVKTDFQIERYPINLKNRFLYTRFPYQPNQQLRLDGECGSDTTKQDPDGIKFSLPYFKTRTLLLIPKDKSDKFLFLKQKFNPYNVKKVKIGVLDGSITGDRVKKYFENSEVDVVNITGGSRGAIDTLLGEKVDALASNEIFLNKMLQTLNKTQNKNEFYVDSQWIISRETYGLVLPGDDDEWVKVINDFLIKEQKDIQKLLQKHIISQNLAKPYDIEIPETKTSNREWMFILLVILGIVTVFGLTYTYWVRRQNSSSLTKPNLDTLDLYHNQVVDSRAIAIAFEKLAQNHPDAKLRFVGVEVQGKDKFLVRADTVVTSDKSELSAEYFDTYNEIKSLPEREIKALMAEKDSRILSLENFVNQALQCPSFYSSIQIKEVGSMASNPGGFSVGGSVGGNANNVQGNGNSVVQGDTAVTGDRNINTGGGNYNERIERDYIQGNYYAAGQPQSLAQAAAEIQLLLKQLEQTYPTTTTSQQMVVAAEAINHIESNLLLKERVINAVKSGGLAAFEKAIDNPAGAFIVGAIKGWQEVEAED